MGRKKRTPEITTIYNPRDKLKAVQFFVDNMLNRTLTMFKYEELPDSLPERELELILQINGYGIITEHEGELVALWGGFAPPMNVYYMFENVLVNNPYANINRAYKIERNEEAVLIRNDPLNRGLMPILEKYGCLITEEELTLYLTLINFRALYNINASTDEEKESAERFLKKLEDGELGVTMSEEISEGIKTLPYGSSSTGHITQIIEMSQYLKGSFYQEIGLNANYNMKRERLSESEAGLNEDVLRPLIDAMLEERQRAMDAVNKKYGTNIRVKFNSSWSQYNEQEIIGEKEDIENGRTDDSGRDAEITD